MHAYITATADGQTCELGEGTANLPQAEKSRLALAVAAIGARLIAIREPLTIVFTPDGGAAAPAPAPDETRAQLRRLVETQAAALREVTAQRDALREAARRVAAWLNCRAMHYVSLGSEDVARGMFDQAHSLETVAAVVPD